MPRLQDKEPLPLSGQDRVSTRPRRRRKSAPGAGSGIPLEEKLARTAVRMRNLLDQKTGLEKRTLRKYLLLLERKMLASKRARPESRKRG